MPIKAPALKIEALRHQPAGQLVGERIAVADQSLTRLLGLVGRRGLAAGEGLWIRPSSGIHTFGMRFAIDVLGLDAKLRVVKLWPVVKPWRVSSIELRVKSVVELSAGEIARLGISVGDCLEIVR